MKWSAEAKVGAFTLAGIITFAVIIVQLSHVILFGKDGFHVTGYFQEAEGITPGNPIRYAGVEVGRVDSVSVDKGQAVLQLRFYDGSEIPKDADFSIQTSSVMGGQFVKVADGHAEKGLLEEGMTVHGSAAPGFESAMNKMDKLADSAQKILDGMNAVVGDRASQDHVKGTLANVDAVTQNLAVLTAQGIQIADHVQRMTAQMDAQMASLAQGFNGDGQAGAKARVILDNLAVTSENAKELSFQARSLSGKLSGASGAFRLSGEGELLYNTTGREFSPNFAVTFGEDHFVRLGLESVGEDSLFNAQYGARRGPWEYYGGMIRGEVGAGLQYRQDKWRIGADMFDPNDLTFRFRGGYQVAGDLFATVQTIQPEKRRGGGHYIGLSYTY